MASAHFMGASSAGWTMVQGQGGICALALNVVAEPAIGDSLIATWWNVAD